MTVTRCSMSPEWTLLAAVTAFYAFQEGPCYSVRQPQVGLYYEQFFRNGIAWDISAPFNRSRGPMSQDWTIHENH